MKTLTVREICEHNDLGVAVAERALASLQEKGLVSGFVHGDLDAKITLTPAAETYFKM
jgi:ribosomal protein S25